MDNHDEQNSTPEPIDFPPNKTPSVHPDPLPPILPPTPKINASALFPDGETKPKKNSPLRKKNINKLTPFTGDQKKIETFIQECKMYLRINRYIYEDNEDKIAFVLSFMNEKEALRWKQTFLRFIMERDEEIIFPPFKNFVKELLSYFQPTNTHQDAAHQLGLLKQGNKTAEEIITEFRLLVSLAGYLATTTSDHLHLIEKL